ncbi:penicillin acylase family protein [Janthinobacterium agaricidamnosum]|uniref:Penicillin amidase family protein n=1 Tax=Janthinobacterium agaricidamnosum NBRC 102515 = DSM 9628 TaxID=1349767 RepID=W0V5D6_9BURK|nr:penicillin acylase family protein [Janthinobacterium agaricidamnosum]CDG83096.1 penicillin amidase family protein [Janthinobacterium agaricidamnosum NBRC 102515 = DSM 9628]
MATRQLRFRLALILGLALSLFLLLLLAAYGALRASLPALGGDVTLPGLSAPVSIQRDAGGVPMIAVADRNDGAYALGFLHAQERFFQMDLLRRSSSGELAALLGPAALEQDKNHRRFRFRSRAVAALAQLDPASRTHLQHYTAGINQGLQQLTLRPFEYLALGAAPQAWRAEDSLLVVWSMYQLLQGNLEPREFARGWIREHSRPEQLALLLPESSRFDTPLDMDGIASPTPPLPAIGPGWIGHASGVAMRTPQLAVGSNAWAWSGPASGHGGAMLANDMHLGLRLPNTWYRAAMRYPADGGQRRVVGLTLPGTPLFVVGSNGKLAWGMTNSYGDYLDLIEVRRDPGHPGQVDRGAGWQPVSDYRETIVVKGGAPFILMVQESAGGLLRQVAGREYAVHWIAQDNNAVNLQLFGMESAASVAEGATVAARAGIPAQNITLADAAGHIGWSIAGPLPRRLATFGATFPYAAGGGPDWHAMLDGADYPRVFDPANGILWSANNRQLGGADYARLGDGGADLGARARQIRDRLLVLREWRQDQQPEAALMAIALDTSPSYMAEWRALALAALTPAAVAGHPARAELRRLLESAWDEPAGVRSVAYRLARGYSRAIYDALFADADARMAAAGLAQASVEIANPRWSELAMRLLGERPPGWLPAGTSWQQLELSAIDSVIGTLTAHGQRLADASWGQRNRADIRHPLATVLPFGDYWLAAPRDPLPGDDDMPRVSAPQFGQSERLVVAPGREEQGLFNMPGGQSGHPLSPFFLAGHADWVHGKAQPLLPGAVRYTLTLRPRRR